MEDVFFTMLTVITIATFIRIAVNGSSAIKIGLQLVSWALRLPRLY
jgi:hypothetical protein